MSLMQSVYKFKGLFAQCLLNYHKNKVKLIIFGYLMKGNFRVVIGCFLYQWRFNDALRDVTFSLFENM